MLNQDGLSVPSIIRVYGSFEQNQTYNVLFEHVDGGTLEHYFRRVKPPTKEEDIVKFWGRLFYLAQAIRNLEAVNSDGRRSFST
jgi:hypothetical protein